MGEASRQRSPQRGESHGSLPPAGKPDGDEGGEVSARDFGGGGGGLMDDCLMIAGAGWIIGMQYNALLWVKVVEVGYLCAGSLADYSSVIAKQS